MVNKILVVAAHPDDEVLGCGGTIARHVSQSDLVKVIFLTDGESARDNFKDTDVSERRQSAVKAREILGIEDIYWADFPDNKMDSVPLIEIVKKIESVIKIFQPSIIYTHHAHDLNIDHRRACQAVITACRPQFNHSVKEIYSFEVLSSTEWQIQSPSHVFCANLIVDISDQIDTKMKAIEAYSQEMREHPHSRSREAIKALASLRGATHGCSFAEAFSVIRIIK
ncbi:MAG: GlcNAc-PI de-N-acetylase [Micavibrio sp.]|nr:GlcNAc-PI de-N-acetylase [Micavibrio sp.]|tara:strand:+ start:155 stop:829 length:675 start_codon:yes stop_codon:yes gene_type:complete